MKLNVSIKDLNIAKNICGIQNKNIESIGELFNCIVDIHGDTILTNLEDLEKVNELEEYMHSIVEYAELGLHISLRDIVYLRRMQEIGDLQKYMKYVRNRKPIGYNFSNRPVFAKTFNQGEYLKLLNEKDLVFATGSAGSGKTYLAVVFAVNMLKKGLIQKIILTRPAVEAGESLGFLPGDLKEKVDPYLRPLYDALYDMLGVETTNSLIEKQVLEIAPLAYMRGRTLENAIIILDEAQNATIEQLKMFLTRLGFNSKMIITGDCSQIDLPHVHKSGLRITSTMLADLKEVGVIDFTVYDVVRHPLVGKIIEKFEALK